MIRKRWRWFAAGFLFLLLIAPFAIYAGLYSNRYPAYHRFAVMARFIAKEYCSCRFVVGRGDKYCRAYVNTSINVGLGIRLSTVGLSRIKVHSREFYQEVMVSPLGMAWQRATYQTNTLCRLVP